jgi:hypothetical protein
VPKLLSSLSPGFVVTPDELGAIACASGVFVPSPDGLGVIASTAPGFVLDVPQVMACGVLIRHQDMISNIMKSM